MATFKLSLFALFLIVLAALVVSMLVGNWFQTTEYHKEGMISFYNGTSSLTPVYIPDYSGKKGNSNVLGENVVLIYDNIFFDQDNANVIEIDSTALNGNVMVGNVRTGNAETDGSSIQNIHISNPNNSDNLLANVNTYSFTDNTLSDSKATSEAETPFQNSYTEMVYVTNSLNTDTYTIFVLPWDESTYIHMINNTKATNVNTTWFGPGNKSSIKTYGTNQKLPFSKKTLPTQNFNENPMINTLVIREDYNKNTQLYQISDCIFFDNTNGVLIIYKNKSYSNFKAYNRDGVNIQNADIRHERRVSASTFSSWTNAFDAYGNLMVLYINNGSNIMIVLIQPTGYSGNNEYTLFNVQRFNRAGLDSGPIYGQTGASHFIGPGTETKNMKGSGDWGHGGWGGLGYGGWNGSGESAGPVGGPTGMMNDYYRWFYYWATQGLNNNPNGPNFNYSDDYIMKTQIVPPVCPSCPSCPSTGTCTHCGGNGGSGTKTSDGTSLAEGDYENRNLNITGDGLTITDAENTIGGVLNNAISQPANIVSDIGNTLEKGASGAVDLAKDTGSGAVNLAKDAGSGAVNLAKDTASGAVNQINKMGSSAVDLGKDIVGGTIDLGKDIVGGIADLGKGYEYRQGQYQGVGSNQYGYSNSYGGGGVGVGGQSAANQLLPKNNASVVDQSNMYGAMPSKGNSNYMPIGSDFSKFGR